MRVVVWSDGSSAFLLQEGADVNIQDLSGNTPLHFTTQKNSTVVTGLLIDKGTDINLKNTNSETPLVYAHKGSEVRRLLLKLQKSDT